MEKYYISIRLKKLLQRNTDVYYNVYYNVHNTRTV